MDRITANSPSPESREGPDSRSYSHRSPPLTAVLLVQLGTPDEPDSRSVRRYLKQFLSDQRVVEIPRLAWWPRTDLELSIVGQNLWDHRHPEFGTPGARHSIPRSVFGKVSWWF